MLKLQYQEFIGKKQCFLFKDDCDQHNKMKLILKQGIIRNIFWIIG